MTVQRIEVYVSMDTRAFSRGNLSHVPPGHDTIGEKKARIELALANKYNKRRYNKVRVIKYN